MVDTNIFLYAADRDAPEHAKCREFIEHARAEALPWFTTWGILYEFLRVATHPRVFRSPLSLGQAWQFVQSALAAPALRLLTHTERHEAIAAMTFQELPTLRGNVIHDAHTAILMREHGIRRIYTHDTDFHRFRFLEVVDPVA